jgi:hypothetical protein
MVDPSLEWTVLSSQLVSGCQSVVFSQWFSGSGFGWGIGAWSTLRRRPQSMRLKAIDSAAFVICDLSEPRSLRGNFRIPRRTPSTSPCARSQTSNRRKLCIPPFSPDGAPPPRRFLAAAHNSLPRPPLTTTEDCYTDELLTQNLDPLSPTSNSPHFVSARMRNCLQ